MYFRDAPLDGDTLLSYISTLHRAGNSSDKTYMTLQNVKHKTTHSIIPRSNINPKVIPNSHFPCGHDYIISDPSLLIKPFKLDDVIIDVPLISPPAAGFNLYELLNT